MSNIGTRNPHKGMSVHALGTGGGPIVSASRAGTSTVVRVDDAAYVIDCGMGSVRNYRPACRWEELRGVFLTHHHSDHIYDLGAFLMTGWQVPGESFARRVDVVGPGRPSQVPALEAMLVPADAMAAGRSMSSTTEIVDALLDGVFASDICIRMADEGRTEPREWIRSRDIEIPAAARADAVTSRHPEMEPFEVYRDEHVSVTAILVDHRLCFPAFAFRFDSAYGSVVISGDTAYSANCRRLAAGADLLVHEVMDLEAILRTFPDGPTREGIAIHLRESHTSYEEVGVLAREAGARRLVLHHIVPNTPGAADLDKIAARVTADFGGPVSVAEDNDVFIVSAVETTADRTDAAGVLA